MNKTELDKLRLFQLKRLASRLEIDGRSGMNKSQLVAALVGKKIETRSKSRVKSRARSRVKPKTSTSTKTNTKTKVAAKPIPKAKAKPKSVKLVAPLIEKRPVPPRAEVPPAAVAQPGHSMPILERSPSQPRTVVHEPEDLPHRYYVNHIVLLPRDPNWLFVYWELTVDRVEKALAELGIKHEQARYALRVHDVTGIDEQDLPHLSDATILQQVELPVLTNTWYVSVDGPGHLYCVEYVMFGPDGRFVQLAKSNLATTPGDRISPEADEEWGAAEARDLRKEHGPARTKWLKELQRALAGTSPGAWGWSGSLSRGPQSK